jgi:hypothetical protein
MLSIPIHSQTDAITNSSTTIYTYSDKSPAACREMIDEIFKTFGINKKCDDVFNLVVLLDNEEYYEHWLDCQGHETEGDLSEMIDKVRTGKVEKPKWMDQAEKKREWGGGSTLNIHAKSIEYEGLATLVRKFLYSTTSEEHSS